MILDLHGRQLKRPAGVDLSDLTTSTPMGSPSWTDSGALVIPLEPDPSEEEARLIRRRLLTADAAEEQWVGALVTARDQLESAGATDVRADAIRLLIDGALQPYAEA